MSTVNLDTLRLAKGAHDDCDDGMCLFEAYNMIRATVHTYVCPDDVSAVLHIYGMRLNDSLGDCRRQELKRFLPDATGVSVLSGTDGDGLDEARSYLALDWLIRTCTPAWLDLAGLTVEAQALRGLRQIVNLSTAHSARPVVREARVKAFAAHNAIWVVRWDAISAAQATWSAAWGVADLSAAWTVADGDAARGAARDAACAAAPRSQALQSTVDQLQTSAIELYAAMVQPC